jgi:hypothetical protein
MEYLRNILLICAIIAHYILVGADVYAQVSITPIALSAPPASLAMYQGDYVYDPTPFWQTANTFALVFLVAALAVNWPTERRGLLLFTLASSIVISAISLSYIFPEYTAIVSSAYSDSIDPALSERGTRWQAIALSRLLIFGCLGLLPLWALTKPTSRERL